MIFLVHILSIRLEIQIIIKQTILLNLIPPFQEFISFTEINITRNIDSRVTKEKRVIGGPSQ